VRFDFARAYRSTDVVPPVVSSGRYAATCEALAGRPMDVAAVERVMRDHYEGGEVHVPGAMPDDPRYFSVCMHADPVGTTTASMVVELDGDASKPLVAWMAMTNPCVSPYLPVFVDAPMPRELTADGEEGAWRRFKVLLTEVEKDFATRAPLVRDFWRDVETGIRRDVSDSLAALPSPGAARTAAERELMERTWQLASRSLEEITGRVRGLSASG
jgi:dipeptidase